MSQGDDDDQNDELWEGAMRDVKPLKGRLPPSRKARQRRTQGADADYGYKAVLDIPVRPKARTGHGLDKRTEERLRRGQMKIEARLDLHGYRLVQAESVLKSFIVRAYEQHLRCVLVITGKGQPKKIDDEDWFVGARPRTIREHVPDWLATPTLGALILKTMPAQPKDGGSGALYVLLRRRR